MVRKAAYCTLQAYNKHCSRTPGNVDWHEERINSLKDRACTLEMGKYQWMTFSWLQICPLLYTVFRYLEFRVRERMVYTKSDPNPKAGVAYQRGIEKFLRYDPADLAKFAMHTRFSCETARLTQAAGNVKHSNHVKKLRGDHSKMIIIIITIG